MGTATTIDNRYTYTGREKNPVSGTMYYRWRSQYSPRIGLFTNKNPWGYIQGRFGLYDYVANRPYRYVEPFSNAIEAGASIGAGVAALGAQVGSGSSGGSDTIGDLSHIGNSIISSFIAGNSLIQSFHSVNYYSYELSGDIRRAILSRLEGNMDGYSYWMNKATNNYRELLKHSAIAQAELAKLINGNKQPNNTCCKCPNGPDSCKWIYAGGGADFGIAYWIGSALGGEAKIAYNTDCPAICFGITLGMGPSFGLGITAGTGIEGGAFLGSESLPFGTTTFDVDLTISAGAGAGGQVEIGFGVEFNSASNTVEINGMSGGGGGCYAEGLVMQLKLMGTLWLGCVNL